MATLTKARKRTKGNGKSPPLQAVPAAFGVFLEHAHDISDPMEPILLRRCINKWEAGGWCDCWSIDEPDFLNAKMVIRPIDADGNAIEEGGAE